MVEIAILVGCIVFALYMAFRPMDNSDNAWTQEERFRRK